MCVAAIHVAGVARAFYAASASAAALAGLARRDAALACAVPVGQGSIPARQVPEDEALPALTACAAQARAAANG